MKYTYFLIAIALFFTACSKKDEIPNDPVEVVKNFVLLCEAGKINEAKKLLAPKNNVDYIDKYGSKNNGKDFIYLDYDYKGNDDVLKLNYELMKNLSTNETAIVKQTSNYLIQHQTFEKAIMLKKIDGKWKITDWLLMPVKVK